MTESKTMVKAFSCVAAIAVGLLVVSTMRIGAVAAPLPPPVTTMDLWGSTWQVDGALVWTNDTVLNRYVRYPFPIPLGRGTVPVTMMSDEIPAASYSIEAFVRIPPGSLSIDFGVSGTNACYRINLSSARNGKTDGEIGAIRREARGGRLALHNACTSLHG